MMEYAYADGTPFHDAWLDLPPESGKAMTSLSVLALRAADAGVGSGPTLRAIMDPADLATLAAVLEGINSRVAETYVRQYGQG